MLRLLRSGRRLLLLLVRLALSLLLVLRMWRRLVAIVVIQATYGIGDVMVLVGEGDLRRMPCAVAARRLISRPRAGLKARATGQPRILVPIPLACFASAGVGGKKEEGGAVWNGSETKRRVLRLQR